MSKKSLKDAERAEAVAELKKLLKPGATVWTVLRHASSSGMFRVIDLVIPYIKEDRRSIYGAPAARFKPSQEVWVNRAEGDADGSNSGGAFVVSRDGESVVVRWEYPDNHKSGPTDTVPVSRLVLIETRKVPALRSIGWLAARAMGDGFDRDRQGVKIGGCGMDMGFSLVYNLGATIWPKGTPKPHGRRNGEPDREGGYALKHSWL